jgi:DNA ligase-1
MKKTKITKIKKIANVPLVRYDLQVENTENFFANDVLVHNCRVLMVCSASDDGIKSVISYSRNGKVFDNFGHIEREILDNLDYLCVKTGHNSFVLDGEVIGNTFQELMRQARRKENVQATDSSFHVFDFIPLPDFTRGFWNSQLRKRLCVLESVKPVIETMPHVHLLTHHIVDLDTAEGRDQLDRYGKDSVAQGFEGIMIKDLEAPYQCKRTVDWLKWKPVITVDLKVIDVEEGTGKNKGRLGALVCHGVDHGKTITVNVGSGFNDDERTDFWNNRSMVIGQTVEILCDIITKNQDGTYSLRFPRFTRFRDDK